MTSIKIKNSFQSCPPIPRPLSLPSLRLFEKPTSAAFSRRGGVQEGRDGGGIRLRAARNRANRMARCKKEIMRARR